MKKTLIAVAALAATGAFAQVSVYGRLDAGYGSYTVTDSAGAESKLGGVLSHNSVSSMWGVQGSEDLGGGLKAMFKLEQDVFTANGNTGASGAGNGTANASGFNRTSLVGVSGGFGQVAFGRDYLPGFSLIGSTDINGLSRMSTVQAASATGGSTLGNQVVYTSPNLSGFTLKAAMINDDRSTTTAGGVTTDSKVKGTNISAVYSNGPLMVGFATGSTETTAGATVTKAEGNAIAAGYDFGKFALKGNYITTKSQTAGVNDAKELNIGATVPMGKLLLKAQVGSNDNGAAADNTGTDIVVGADYSLSAKTAVYFTTGTVNKVGPNQKTTGTAVGIKTTF